MTIVKQIFGNYLLMSALCAWLIAQILKVFTGMFSEQKFSFFKLFFSNGGMPSSHSATVMALTTACAISYGFGSAPFAISLIVSIIVAKILNRITRELFSGNPDNINTGLKELVGHTPFQVLMGALCGIAVGVLMAFPMGEL